LANLEGVAAESKAVITCDHLPSIQSIKVLLAQLFQNLIGNAIQYRAEERTPEIAITSYVGADGAQVFAVRDNGIGIEPQHREYVFDVFKRLHGNRYSGTGIGLAICKAAVERLGEKILDRVCAGQWVHFLFLSSRK
jgi:signal transduction histidine kinase